MLQSDDKIRVMAIKLNGKDKRDKGIRTPTQTGVLFDRTLFCFISYETSFYKIKRTPLMIIRILSFLSKSQPLKHYVRCRVTRTITV